jgi:hypothetical protein
MEIKLGRTTWNAKVLADVVHYGACHAVRFHDKAYIFSVWELLYEQGMIKGSFTSFQNALLDLHKHDFITLSRADLVAAMDPDLLQKSVTLHPTGRAEFHFVAARC